MSEIDITGSRTHYGSTSGYGCSAEADRAPAAADVSNSSETPRPEGESDGIQKPHSVTFEETFLSNLAIVQILLASGSAKTTAWIQQNRLECRSSGVSQKASDYSDAYGDGSTGNADGDTRPKGHGAREVCDHLSEADERNFVPVKSENTDPPLTSAFSLDVNGELTGKWQPPATLEEFVEKYGGTNAAVSSWELAQATVNVSPEEKCFLKLAMVYKRELADKGLISKKTVTAEEYNSLLAVFSAIQKGTEQRVSMNQSGDANNFGFMMNLMDIFHDEYSLYENFNSSVADGDRSAITMSAFSVLARAAEGGDNSTITEDDLKAIVADSGSQYSLSDKAFAQRLLDDPNLMAKMARYDVGGPLAISEADLRAVAKNYNNELMNPKTGLFQTNKLLSYANSETNIMNRTFTTWKVDEQHNTIHLDNGWKVRVLGKDQAWEIIDPEGNVARSWGDPHVDLRAKGQDDDESRDFDYRSDLTFFAGGAKITVGTTGDGDFKVSDTLTITSEGGQVIQVKGIAEDKPEFVDQGNGALVGTNGKEIDRQTQDGMWLINMGTAMTWIHDANQDGKTEDDLQAGHQMNSDYAKNNGF